MSIEAAEYVLGTLSGDELAQFKKDLLVKPELQREIVKWEEHFAPLSFALPEQEPSSLVWKKIIREIEPTIIEKVFPKKFEFWKIAVPAFALAAVLMIALILPKRTQLQVEPVQYQAELKTSASKSAWTVSVMAEGKKIAVKAVSSNPIADNQSYELWMLPSDKSAPVSLGVVAMSGETHIELNELQQKTLLQSSGLAISLEPRGGSTTGAPSGPVLFSGPIVKLSS